MIRLFVHGIGLLAPGLMGWEDSRRVLNGAMPYESGELRPGGAVLPPIERRRSTPTIRAAVDAAHEALLQSGLSADEVATIFACSGGDMDILHHTCDGLAASPPDVSPTRFHNSVHNAPAGYWSIAAGSRQPSTSLSCYDDTFCAGLLEAAAQAATQNQPVLLVVYELAAPMPLHAVRPVEGIVSVALLLSMTRRDQVLAELELSMTARTGDDARMSDPALESLRRGNPAARALPLLATLARGGGELVLPYLDSGLHIRVRPC